MVRQDRFRYFAEDRQCYARGVVTERIKKRLNQLALIDAHELSRRPFKEPDAHMREPLERRAKPALHTPRTRRDSAHATHGSRKKTYQTVSFAQRIAL